MDKNYNQNHSENEAKKKKKKKSLSSIYLERFSTSAVTTLEKLSAESTTNLSDNLIKEKTENSKAELYRIIDNYLDKKSELYAIADFIADKGQDALKAVANRDDSYLRNNPEKTSLLEVIVRTDGSRPSFMIRDGIPDKNTSPVGDWSDYLDLNGDLLKRAIAAVGRIDVNNEHIGTGFLVQQNLIVTNRHVLQAIATKENNGSWLINSKASIDFGYEFRARKTIHRRNIKKLVFCGPQFIDPYKEIDHNKLDLALIELESSNDEGPAPLSMNIAPEWADPKKVVYTIGYPGDPGIHGLKTYSTLLEQLFQSTYGYKRLAPGHVISSVDSNFHWKMAHDSTTLGGNSGSVVLVSGKEFAAAGLHYGGTLRAPRENWGHILANTLDSTNGNSDKTLKDYLKEYKVHFVDIVNSSLSNK